MEMNYRIELYTIDTVDGEQWVAEYIDIPHCVGGGVTQQEAIKEAKENLEIYLDTLKLLGKEIPSPSKHLEPVAYNGNISARLPKSLHKDLSEIAKREGCSINSILTNFLSASVERYKAQEGVQEAIDEYYNSSLKQLNKVVLQKNVSKKENWNDAVILPTLVDWS